jgi:hypothetical protein
MPKIKEGHTDIVWSRVDAVVLLILGNPRYMETKRNIELTNLVVEQFNVSKRTAERYISLAKREVRKIGKEKKEKAFLKAIRDREYLITQIRKSSIRDFRIELEVMKDRDKLYGLYSDNINHSGIVTVKNIDMSQFTDYGLEMLANGIPIEKVMLEPKALRRQND